ncbi:MAG: TolC family protein [Bacteroidota bacterium]
MSSSATFTHGPLLILLLVLVQLIGSQSAPLAQAPLSLSQAIEVGLANNYQIQISQQREAIAGNNNSYAAAGRYPRIDFNLTSNNALTNQNNPASFINGGFVNGGLTGNVDLAWTVFDGYKVRINKKRLAEIERQSQGSTQQILETTIQQIILAYHQVLVQREQLSVLREVLTLSRDRLAFQELRRELGQAGTFDVLQNTDAYLNDSTSVLVQQQSYRTAVRNLNLAMGVDQLNRAYTFTDTLAAERTPYDYENLATEMLANNIELQNLRFSRSLAAIDRELQESNRYPSLRINTGGNATGTFFQLFTDDPRTGEPFPLTAGNSLSYYLNFTATFPLYDAGTRRRSIQNAVVEEQIAQLGIEDLKRSLSLQLTNSLETYRNQVQLLALTESLRDNAQRNLDIAAERFQAGQINSFDYRSIQIAYINAAQARLNALFNLKSTETELIRLTGGLLR